MIYYSMSKLTKFGAKLSKMHGIICLDCAINIHCALNQWQLSDADGTVGVKNLTSDFKNIFDAHLDVLREIQKSSEYCQISRVPLSSTPIYVSNTALCFAVGLNVP